MWKERQQLCRFVHSVASLITFLPHLVCIYILGLIVFSDRPTLIYTTVHRSTWCKSFSDHSTPSIRTQNYNSATWSDLLASVARSSSLVVLLGMSACSLQRSRVSPFCSARTNDSIVPSTCTIGGSHASHALHSIIYTCPQNLLH
jgi:hypothetical protein